MKKTISANIGGILFQIDEDAYFVLEQYFRKIEAGYNYSAEGKEIINDLENRLSELLAGRTNSRSHTISFEDITWAIGVLGRPEDLGAKQSTYQGATGTSYYRPARRLYRDPDSRVIGGVCGGMGAYFDIDPVLLRVLFFVALFVGFGALAYIILWIAIPKARTVSQKLEMHGEPPTPENIRKYS